MMKSLPINIQCACVAASHFQVAALGLGLAHVRELLMELLKSHKTFGSESEGTIV